MCSTGKKATFQEPTKSFLETETSSELIASLRINKRSKIFYSRKGRAKPKSHVQKVDSTLSKGSVVDSSIKGGGNDSSNRKLICRKILHKKADAKSSKKPASSNIQGETSPTINTEGSDKIANRDVKIGKVKKGRKKIKKKRMEQDDAQRLQRRARYLMIKMKLEQNLIDAYSGEGWKGQSREKIKPEKELLRAKKQILKCKLGIRDTLHQLDSLSSIGCIEESVIAPDGSVHHEHIFCAICKLREAFPDNDIVLCDGTCNCAFHQKCLDPPLHTDSIPPEDEGWFCRFCECKMAIIDAMNAHLGTDFFVDSKWEDIFKDEAAFPDGRSALLNSEEDWPSDDSEDEDYDPERREKSYNMNGAGTDDDASVDTSSSTSLSWSSQNKTFSGSRRWEMDGDMDSTFISTHSSFYSDDTSEGEIICGRRRRKAVDYKKLYDEMFGKDAQVHEQLSEDEDWGPAKRKRREKESDAACTLITLCESEQNCRNIENIDVKRKLPRDLQNKRSFFRIPPKAVELRLVFAENELPSRTVKENLAEELSLEPIKVSKWFKNARYLALKTRKMEKADLFHGSSPKISKMSASDTLVCTKDLEKNHLRRKLKSLRRNLKINQQIRASFESPVNSSKLITEYCDDVSLKRLLKLRKRREKKVNFVAGGGFELAEAEMERLCLAKRRIERMKQTMLRLQKCKAKKSSKRDIDEESVIYVPIAELREKE
ncbi:pathogenesis-related homeodomain protein isoform X2 [Tripterygium wilfordii]|uniref:pathogenesis-related homeodomain protein isoform X2 n=1 Tax=Tripterygium wilfordii TaxID=458696 RepID=UPI0018F7FA3B|nr:pathogenesis-related homeodomain protein isoform X2 [Tripterygium wilfordii]